MLRTGGCTDTLEFSQLSENPGHISRIGCVGYDLKGVWIRPSNKEGHATRIFFGLSHTPLYVTMP